MSQAPENEFQIELHETSANEDFDDQLEDAITPPPSLPTPSPPPEPSSPTLACASIRGINKEIYDLKIQLRELEMIVTEPNIIVITGVRNLKIHTGINWHERMCSLLQSARIPIFWILDMIPDDEHSIYDLHSRSIVFPETVRLYVISYQVKQKIIAVLNDYLFGEYNNAVYLLE
jgi:hypothetical protein